MKLDFRSTLATLITLNLVQIAYLVLTVRLAVNTYEIEYEPHQGELAIMLTLYPYCIIGVMASAISFLRSFNWHYIKSRDNLVEKNVNVISLREDSVPEASNPSESSYHSESKYDVELQRVVKNQRPFH